MAIFILICFFPGYIHILHTCVYAHACVCVYVCDIHIGKIKSMHTDNPLEDEEAEEGET